MHRPGGFRRRYATDIGDGARASCAAQGSGPFLEFFGGGRSHLTPPTQVIANMLRSTRDDGLFRRRCNTSPYFRRPSASALVDAIESYFRAQDLFGIPREGDIDYSQVIELDLAAVAPSVAGPKRPQDRIDLPRIKSRFAELFEKSVADGGYGKPVSEMGRRVAVSSAAGDVARDVLIRPSLRTNLHPALCRAGLLAKRRSKRAAAPSAGGTSLARGPRRHGYLRDGGLIALKEHLGFAWCYGGHVHGAAVR